MPRPTNFVALIRKVVREQVQEALQEEAGERAGRTAAQASRIGTTAGIEDADAAWSRSLTKD